LKTHTQVKEDKKKMEQQVAGLESELKEARGEFDSQVDEVQRLTEKSKLEIDQRELMKDQLTRSEAALENLLSNDGNVASTALSDALKDRLQQKEQHYHAQMEKVLFLGILSIYGNN